MKYIAIYTSKISGFILTRFFKKGSSLPGKIALKIDKNILAKVSKSRHTILITGTNGKTTTTSLLYNILKKEGYDVITNATGANLISGITACFIKGYKPFHHSHKKRYAVIEIDEATMKGVCSQIKPRIIMVTNLFRDQLDRYGEVYTTLNKILEGINLAPNATVILNGDEPLLGNLAIPNKKIYFGFHVGTSGKVNKNIDAGFCSFCGNPYHYDFITFNHLGKYHCTCGQKRPNLQYHVDKIEKMESSHSIAVFNGTSFTINQAGLYNIYNALSAYSIACELHVKEETLKEIFAIQAAKFGRQEIIEINGKTLTIFLVKNPAGYNQTLETIALTKTPFNALFMLNDNVADGTDISWIYDVDLEKIKQLPIKQYFVSGIRMYDMATRLKIAVGNQHELILEPDFEELTNKLIASPEKDIYALLTYTAMLSYRKYLQQKGYIKEYWR